jgi:transcriptional regulator GlxA family with amidase domain
MTLRIICLTVVVTFMFCLKISAAESKQLRVGFLVLDHVYNSELMAPYDIFHHTIFHTKPGMKVFTIASSGTDIETFEGLKLKTDFSIDNAPDIDILVIPSAEHNMDRDLNDQRLKEWVTYTAQSADFVVTLCDGAFILANTGLLNGKNATTFPSDVGSLRKLFPAVQVKENYSFVHDSKFITSQRGAKSYDAAALYLVAQIYGDEVAEGVARGLVLTWPNNSIQFFRTSAK